MKSTIAQIEQVIKTTLTPELIQSHVNRYLTLTDEPTLNRRRSFELLEEEKGLVEQTEENNCWDEQCRQLEQDMEWLEVCL